MYIEQIELLFNAWQIEKHRVDLSNLMLFVLDEYALRTKISFESKMLVLLAWKCGDVANGFGSLPKELIRHIIDLGEDEPPLFYRLACMIVQKSQTRPIEKNNSVFPLIPRKIFERSHYYIRLYARSHNYSQLLQN